MTSVGSFISVGSWSSERLHERPRQLQVGRKTGATEGVISYNATTDFVRGLGYFRCSEENLMRLFDGFQKVSHLLQAFEF